MKNLYFESRTCVQNKKCGTAFDQQYPCLTEDQRVKVSSVVRYWLAKEYATFLPILHL